MSDRCVASGKRIDERFILFQRRRHANALCALYQGKDQLLFRCRLCTEQRAEECVCQSAILLFSLALDLVESQPFNKVGTLLQTSFLHQTVEILRAQSILLLKLPQLSFESMNAL